MKKLNLADLKVQSFVTSAHGENLLGGRAAVDGLRAVAGETLDERPCTFPSMEPEGCKDDQVVGVIGVIGRN